MSLYYFDTRDLDEVVPDKEGTELSSMDEVQNEAAYALAAGGPTAGHQR
jgi:hypothetical protein